jgi:hypothetical protein
MPITYFKIASVTVGSGGAANIEFTSIPATFTDLSIKFSLRAAYSGGTGSGVKFRFNNSATGYSYRQLYGFAGSGGSFGAASTTELLFNQDSASNTANTFASCEVYVPNYLSSNNKSVSIDSVVEQNASSGYQLDLIAGLWANSAAITSIKIEDFNATNFLQYSTATLYGIKKD